MRQLLDRLEDVNTGEVISELHVDIPPNRYKELYDVAQELKEEAIKKFPLVKGAKNVTENPLTAIIARGWETKMEITGASGLP